MGLTEKQKNCPYCHGMKRMQDRLIYGTRRDILALKDNSLEYTLVLPDHKEYEVQATRRDILALKDNSLEYTLVLPDHKEYEVQAYVEYCPMCGRYLLNEEEE